MAKEIEIQQSIHERNALLAAELNQALTRKGIFCVNIMGAPGVGKTSSLTRIAQYLELPMCVIEGDIESDIDAQKLREQGIHTIQINTGGACHLDSPLVANAAAAVPDGVRVLVIENIGNLVCPAEFMIGEHIKLLLCAVTEGSDKPYKYPLAFEKADAIVIGKRDLVTYVDFDEVEFIEGVRRLNPDATVFFTSAKTGEGFDELAGWIREKAEEIA